MKLPLLSVAALIVSLSPIARAQDAVIPATLPADQAQAIALAEAMTRAAQLASEGKTADAFKAYLAISGAECAAVRLVRGAPKQYLPMVEGILANGAAPENSPRALLVTGDLLLATGDKAGALKRYREAIGKIAPDNKSGWAEGKIPADYYPVELPVQQGGEWDEPAGRGEPFVYGPGSHRDNWLIRRFIALEAWEDAAREFDRIAALHKAAAADGQLSGLGLQFTLDYAYFLKKRDLGPKALEALLDAILRIDLDRLPPHIGELAGMYRWHHAAGFSRKEFIRIAYGEFKTAAKENELVAALEKQVGQRNQARRTLARVRMLQGRPEDSLALELEFIKAADMNDASKAYRRGVVYEDAKRNQDAATEYEKFLALPAGQVDVPAADEDPRDSQMMQARVLQVPAANDVTGLEPEVVERLRRLYAALGQTDKALALSLRQLESNPRSMSIEVLERTGGAMKTAGKADAWSAWIKGQLEKSTDSLVRANIRWVLGERDGVMEELIKHARASAQDAWVLNDWKERFRNLGVKEYRALLVAIVAARPTDVRSRLELLDLDNRFDGKEAIEAMELILDGNLPDAFSRYKGSPANRTQFRDHYDLAYRLMRMYEKTGDTDKLIALGMRVLEGKAPFKRDSALKTPVINWNNVSVEEEALDCVYIMLPHLRKQSDLDAVKAVAQASDCIPLKNQVARLIDKGNARRIDPAEAVRRPATAATVRTMEVPAGVNILTNREDARAVDAQGEWVGTSWGLVRYHSGAEGKLDVLQMPVGARVTAFCRTPAGLFVGAGNGLYQLTDPEGDKPSLARLDLPAIGNDRPSPPSVEQLLWWKDGLWMIAGGAAYRLDPRKNEVQRVGENPGRLFVGAGKLWAQREVFDEAAGEFRPIACEYEQWQCIGASAKEIWADVYVDDARRHRPALIDPQTLKMNVLPIANVAPGKQMMVNGLFGVVAEDAGRVWLHGDYAAFVYDKAKAELRTASGGDSLKPDVAGIVYHAHSPSIDSLPGLNLRFDRGPLWCWADGPANKLLVGGARVREWREDNLGYDDDSGMSQQIQDFEGGLIEVDAKTHKWELLGSSSDQLSDFYVKRIYFDDAERRAYVCTNGGVTILSLPDCAVAGRITISDGLPSNKVEDVIRVGRKLYLACELGDDRGGLAIMDLDSGLIQSRFMADGLGSDKVRRLRLEGQTLHILHGTVYSPRSQHASGPRWVSSGERGDNRVVACMSTLMDTRTGALSEGKEVLPAPAAPDSGARIPYLGGSVLLDETHGGKRFIGGTHGLVIVAEGQFPADSKFASVAITARLSRRQQQLADAQRVQIVGPVTPERLKNLMDSPNPYIVANALAACMQGVNDGKADLTPLIASRIADPCYQVRTTAVALLSRAKDDGAIAPLQIALNDSDAYISVVAALALARRGQLPDLRYFEPLLVSRNHFGNLPYGADSSVGVEASVEQLHRALSHYGTPDVFTFLMRSPPALRNYSNDKDVFPALGAALREHPESIDVLLKAYDGPREDHRRVEFARDVLHFAGKAVLPPVQKGLASPERVIRSNAARACGTIGDASSIPLLLKALDLESGLSRASIVWALGELKASEAIPPLVKLYIDARNDEQRRSGAGYRMAQAQVAIREQYDSLSNLDALGGDWTELTAAALAHPADPREHEDLLTPAHILEAVAKIGPRQCQEFYRALAGGKDAAGRLDAARHLADCAPADAAQNMTILRNLESDGDYSVRVAAAVSLLVLGDGKTAEPLIGKWLSEAGPEMHVLIRELLRIPAKDGGRLAFAVPALEKLSARPELDQYTRQAVNEVLARRQGR